MFKWLLKLRNGLFLAGMLMPLGSLAQDEVTYVELTVENAPLYFYAFNKTKDATNKVLQLTSPEYRAASDEFTRQDLYKRQAPEIERKLAQAKQYPYVFVTMMAELPEYDFERGGFPTGIPKQLALDPPDKLQDIESLKHLSSEDPAAAVFGAFIVKLSKYEGSYTVNFDNSLDAKFLSVPLEQARQLAKALANNRAATYRIYGEVVRVETSSAKEPVIAVVIKKLNISLNSGEHVGHMPVAITLTEEEKHRQVEVLRLRPGEVIRRSPMMDIQAKRKAEEAAREAAQRKRRQDLALQQQKQVVAKYVPIIQQKVRRFWRLDSPNVRKGLSCQVRVRLIPGGEVVAVQIVESSGDFAFDRSVEVAVRKASPLLVPSSPTLFEAFRNIQFVFKPRD